VRAPNGVMQDGRDYWASARPLYNPADIRVPTLLMLGVHIRLPAVYFAAASSFSVNV
jgi:hypothetical protein